MRVEWQATSYSQMDSGGAVHVGYQIEQTTNAHRNKLTMN